MTRHFIGLPGFLHRLPLVPADGGADSDARRTTEDLRAGRSTTVRVMLQGRQVDLQLNPGALMWWYVTSEEEQPADEVDVSWPPPGS